MKRFIKIVGFISVSLFFINCKMSLLDKPTPEPDVTLDASDYADEISAPVDLTATQGGCKVVTLSWKALPNAVQYKIFSANTPFDTFKQVAETSDNSTSIDISEKSGITKYYRIKAVNYYGTISDFSNIVMGSTLSTPVITSIESSENGTVATINWWMENCSKSTYQNLLNYIITCYGEDGTTVVSTLTAEGADTSVTFENLTPKTNYFFQVEAFLTGNQDDVEKSDKLDAETARRLIPKAAVDFSAKQGVSADFIELSWKLPEFVDYALGKNTYEQHPVYFTIERKQKDAEDSSYVKIISYIGIIAKDDKLESDSEIIFDCTTGTSSSENLSITAGTEDSTELYPEYIPGSTLTLKDFSTERGIQYTYKITSYVDDTTKTISCDEAKSSADGWMINDSSFTSKGTYSFDESGELITTTAISFTAAFNTFDINYKYIITEQYTPFKTQANPYPVSETETAIFAFTTIEEVVAAKKVFDCTDSNLKIGNYKYRLYIVSADSDSTNFSNAYSFKAAIGYVVVAANKEDLPKISWVEVADGYKDKFIISWEYKDTMKYSYKWIPFDKTENDVQAVDIPEASIKIADISASFIIPANSNDYGHLILTCTPKDGTGHTDDYSLEETFYTLGTAEPAMEGYYYDKIQISWPVVQRAKSSASDYVIQAWYSDDSTKKDLISTGNTKLEKIGTNIVCTISQPEGYNTSEYSGKAIEFSVTSKSSTTDDSTTAKSIVRTLGPAAVNTKIISDSNVTNYTNANQIVIEWDEIKGISDYKILRANYSYDNFDAVEKTDVYEITKNPQGNISVQILDGNVDSSLAVVSYNSENKKFTLIDKYKEDDDNPQNPYKANQSKIAWGIPFGYSIFPVNSMSDVSFTPNEITMDSSSQLQLKQIVPLKAATYGFGINLRAEKAVNGSKQTLTWNKPYNCNRPPFIYKREFGKTQWEYVPVNTSANATTATIEETDAAKKLKAYEYIVSYNTNSENLDVPSSFIAELAEHPDTVAKSSEPMNKGYLLSLSFNADFGFVENSTDRNTYYREKLSWSDWDYTEKEIGPKNINIYILNKNFNDGWKELCSLTENCRFISKNSKLNDILFEDSDSTILYISPEGISKGTNTLTNGDLKVLRDTKHYYKIEIINDNGKTVIGEDESIFTYRQITDAELCRCVGLIIAESLHKSGIPYKKVSGSDTLSTNGTTGSFNITGYTVSTAFPINYTNYITWSFNNYTHKYKNGYSSKYNTEVSSIFLLSSETSGKAGGSKYNLLYHLPSLPITITTNETTCNLDSYKGTVTFSAGAESTADMDSEKDVPNKYTKWNISIQKDSNPAIAKENDKAFFQQYFPYELGSSNSIHPEESQPWYY